MSSWMELISSQTGTLLDGLQEWVNKWNGSCSGKEDDGKLIYYEELLEDLELEFENLTPSLKDKIKTLKLEVRYILPYMTCGLLTKDKTYEETQRPHFRIKCCPKALVEFVQNMMEQILLVKPDATEFYLGASEGECDWLIFSEFVMDNLNYVQGLDDNQAVFSKEQLKAVEERLRFVVTFVKLAAKRNYAKLDDTEANINDIYDSMGSVSRDAAHIFLLFTMEDFDRSKTEAHNLRLSELQEKIHGVQLLAKEAYFDILAVLKLCIPDTCPLKCETLYELIDSLQNSLKEVCTYLHIVRYSGEEEIQAMIMEIEFLKSILMVSLDDLSDHGILDAIATHIDVLASEAECAVSSYSADLDDQHNHETTVKITGFNKNIARTKQELRQTNIKDEMIVDCLIEDFMSSLGPLLTESIMLELGFWQVFLRCTRKWYINHQQLQAMRSHTEIVVRHAWWDIRCLSFRKRTSGEEIAREEITFLHSDLVKKLILYRPDVKEVCAKIRDSKPSSPSRLCKKFGLDFADVQCKLLSPMQTCKSESNSPNGTFAAEMAMFFGCLHQIAAHLFIEGRRPNGILTFLEDLIDRAACLSYLELVDNASQTMSLKELLMQVDESEVRSSICTLIAPAIWKRQFLKLPTEVKTLAPVSFLVRFLEGLIRTDASVISFMKDHIKTVLRELIVLRCILTDPLMQFFEQDETDELLNDIGAAVCEAGLFYFFSRVNETKVNIFFKAKDIVRCLSATVRQVYSKFSNLSPSKLHTHEVRSLNILLANLIKLSKSKADSAGFPARQLYEMQNDLQSCNSFLGDTVFAQDELGTIKRLRTRILNVGCKVESSIDTFDEVPDWYFIMRLSTITEEIKIIREDMKEIGLITDAGSSSGMAQKYEVADCSKGEAIPPEIQDEVIGFENEETELTKHLRTGSKSLEIMSIVGMSGVGKTTLAMKVYEAIAPLFHGSAWCYVSQHYRKKVLLQQILNEIDGPNDGMNELSEDCLAYMLYQSLMKKKDYLIVLDDIWDISAWNELKMCFPQGNNRNRILVTSRSKVVGLQAASCGDFCIALELLSTDKSWLLLKKSVFGSRSCPRELHEVGLKVADRCGGLPLSIVVIAGVLKNKAEKEEEWEQVAENLNSLVQLQDGVSNKLELSYKHLSIHQKQCFLYCGSLNSTPLSKLMRKGKVRRSKLVQLLVAEKLVEETDQQRSLEAAAEYCLMDLISRNLLIAAKKWSDGQIKTCRIHDLLRDFCIRKAHEEKFLHIIPRSEIVGPFPNWQQRVHVCLHMLAKFKYSIWSKPRTRSLTFTECDLICMVMDYDYMFHIFEQFPLLNVLNLGGTNLGSFPESVTELTSLSYLAVGCRMAHIPSSISKLLNLETLIVNGNSEGVQVPDTIFGLKMLRHLVVSPHTHFTSKSSSSSDCMELETLSTAIFCCCNSCKETIRRLPGLRKLKCILRGSIRYGGFPDLDSLSHLESLKASYSGMAPCLCKFRLPILPVSLKRVSLSKFELPWSEMETISTLPHLEYLKLQNAAFRGKKWDTCCEFPSLKYLILDSLDVEEWEASDDHFPCLLRLVVRGCKYLKSVPCEFSNIYELECIEIDKCGRSVADSAEKIEYDQRKCMGNMMFKTVTSCIEEMVPIDIQANKEKLCSSLGVILAYECLLAVWRQNGNNQ